MRTYSTLVTLKTFEERYEYLRILGGEVGFQTFGHLRFINQTFYRSQEWRRIRERIILRDNACDLAFPDRSIIGHIRIHHMNPVTIQDFDSNMYKITNEDFLVCTSLETHNAIHFGTRKNLLMPMVERKAGDTSPWKVY